MLAACVVQWSPLGTEGQNRMGREKGAPSGDPPNLHDRIEPIANQHQIDSEGLEGLVAALVAPCSTVANRSIRRPECSESLSESEGGGVERCRDEGSLTTSISKRWSVLGEGGLGGETISISIPKTSTPLHRNAPNSSLEPHNHN